MRSHTIMDWQKLIDYVSHVSPFTADQVVLLIGCIVVCLYFAVKLSESDFAKRLLGKKDILHEISPRFDALDAAIRGIHTSIGKLGDDIGIENTKKLDDLADTLTDAIDDAQRNIENKLSSFCGSDTEMREKIMAVQFSLQQQSQTANRILTLIERTDEFLKTNAPEIKASLNDIGNEMDRMRREVEMLNRYVETQMQPRTPPRLR